MNPAEEGEEKEFVEIDSFSEAVPRLGRRSGWERLLQVLYVER